jgi:hypothetical protein
VKEATRKIHYIKQLYDSVKVESNATTGMFHMSGHADIHLMMDRMKQSANSQSFFLSFVDDVLTTNLESSASLSHAYIFLQQQNMLRHYKEILNGTFRIFRTLEDSFVGLKRTLHDISVSLDTETATRAHLESHMERLNNPLTGIKNMMGMLHVRLC